MKRKIFYLLFPIFIVTQLLYSDETADYIHYRLGVKYKNEKRYEQALEEFRKVLAAYPDNYNAYMHISEIRQEQGQYRLVIYNLKKALTYNPGWSKAQKLIANAYEKDGQLQKAILELQQYQQQSDPQERDSIQQVITQLINKISGQKSKGSKSKDPEVVNPVDSAVKNEKVEKSVDQKNKEIKHAKQLPDPRRNDEFSRAVDLYNERKYEEALKELRIAIEKNPKNPGAYYYAGLIRRRFGQNGLAKINFLRSFDYPDMGHNAHFYLGKIYNEEKNYGEAARHLTLYIQKTNFDEGKKEAQSLLDKVKPLADEQALLSLSDVEKARADSIAAAAAVPEEKYATFEVRIDSLLTMMVIDTLTDAGQKLLHGIKLFSKNEYDEAIKSFRKILSENPRGLIASHSIYNTGICYIKLRLFKPAENQFQQIIERYPNSLLAPQAAFFKAMTRNEQGDAKLAERFYRDFIQQYGNHKWVSQAFERLGDIYMDQEDPRKAIDAYNAAVQRAKKPTESIYASYKLGLAFQKVGNNARAESAFLAVITIGEKNNNFNRVPDAYYKIADLRYQKKEYAGALEFYKKVTRKFPAYQETPWGLFQIGSIYKNQNNYRESIETLKELIQKYPDDYWSKQAKWKIDDAIWENEYKTVIN